MIGSWKCPSTAASCLKSGEQYVSLGEAESAPTFHNDVLVLTYTGGEMCPDKLRKKSTFIRFQCDKDKVVRVRRHTHSHTHKWGPTIDVHSKMCYTTFVGTLTSTPTLKKPYKFTEITESHFSLYL